MSRPRLGPPELPYGFWTRPDVLEVLTGRDLAALLRLVRKYAGASQTVIGSVIGMTQAQVSEIMSRKRQVMQFDVIERVFDGLEATDEARMAFGLAPRSAVAATDAVRSEVYRRDVLGLGGALVITTAFTPTTRLGATMLAPLSGPDLDPTPVADLARRVQLAWELRQRADYDALGDLLPDLLGQAEFGPSVLESDDERERATRAVVHTYNAASSYLRRVGDVPLALLAADRAVRAARTIDDPVLVAAALYRLANVLLGAGRVDEARAVALQAADLAAPGKVQTARSLAVWGGLLLTAAVAVARSGQEPEAWELLGEARAGSRMLGTDHADIYSIFGPTNVAIHGVQVAVELHNGGDAVRRSTQVDPDQLPPSLAERRGQYLIDLADAHVQEGHDGEAVVTLQRAESVAPQEVRLSGQVHGLLRTLLDRERTGAAPGLRDLAEQVGVAA
jgi:tetratricopeptide (TPR) repeat protein